MAKRVYEIAKEMNLTNKEILDRLKKEGVEVKSHMSMLEDEDIKKLKSNKTADSPKPAPSKPIGMPLSQRPAGSVKKPPIGRPIIDNAYLDSKSKANKGADDTVKSSAGISENKVKENEVQKNQTHSADIDNGVKANGTVTKSSEVDNIKDSKAIPVEKHGAKKDEVKHDSSSLKDKAALAGGSQSDNKYKASGNASGNDKGHRESASVERAESTNFKRSGTSAGHDENKRTHSEKSLKNDGARRGERTERRDRNDRTDKNDRSDRNDRFERGGRNDKNNKNNRYDRNNKNDNRDNRTPGSGNRKDENRFSRDNKDSRNFSEGRNSGRNDKRGERSGGGDLSKMETKNEYKKRDEKKKSRDKHDKNKEHTKYDKLERRSLEKQVKKKYVKPKQNQEPEVEVIDVPEGAVVINVPITVAGFCEQTGVSTSQVIMTLMKLGIMANINQTIDEATVMVLGEEMNIQLVIGKVEEESAEEGLETFKDDEKDLKGRAPIITVMGHVDHGKTSLLDAIRNTNVTASESGGITQHIGASEVRINGQKIVFLDTPGHEAFTAMRARGAHVTDIAVLVVAADDSVKPQTIESISHAKAAGVPIIVAINKMDKPGANPDMVKKDLADNGVLVEDWGGDVICVPVSAKKGEGIVNLLEMILLQAEVLELKANPNRLAMGSVIEARLDKSKGPVATLLVTNGTLESGQSIVAGTCSGRIRLMTDFKGKQIKKAGPATAVEILGLTEVPQAGDEFNAVKEDKIAREIAENRKEKLREEVLAKNASSTLEQLFSQIQEGEVKELNLIIKGDVQGSVGALVASLEKLSNENVKVNIIHTGVGTVTESDVMLAGTSGSIIIGFNVRPSTAVQTMADRESIQIRTYRVIYDVIDDVANAMKGMLDPEYKEEILGKVQIRNTFKVPGVGIVGGAYVTEGKVVRNAEVRLVRDGIVIHEGKISSLKRFKDDAKEVNQGFECGIGIEDYNDIKENDIIECFQMVEIERA